MSQGLPTAVAISLLVTGLVSLAWLVWGIREYRRTGRAQWLWMSILLGVSVVVVLARYPG